MSREYFTVVAYTTDGAVLCRKCGEKANLPAAHQITESAAQEFAEDGLYCDTCGYEIVEQTRYCQECSGELDSYEDYLCEVCYEEEQKDDTEGEEQENSGL